MNQLTAEQIKTLEDAFASYPEDFSGSSRYTTMNRIQEQLINPIIDSEGNVCVYYETPHNKDKYGYTFSVHKIKIEKGSSK